MLRRGMFTFLNAAKQNFPFLARRVAQTTFTPSLPISRTLKGSLALAVGSTGLMTAAFVKSKEREGQQPFPVYEVLIAGLKATPYKRSLLYNEGADNVARALDGDFERLIGLLALFKSKERMRSSSWTNNKLSVLTLLQAHLPQLIKNSEQLGKLVRLLEADDFKGEAILDLINLLSQSHLQSLAPDSRALLNCLHYALRNHNEAKIALIARLGGEEYLAKLLKTREEFADLQDALPASSRKVLLKRFTQQAAPEKPSRQREVEEVSTSMLRLSP